MLNIGINGFGRIGRMVLRAYLENLNFYKNINIVAINDICDLDTNIHLLKYDSVHGRLTNNIERTEWGFVVDGTKICVMSSPEPEKIDWNKCGVDVVFECSGRFLKKEDARKHVSGNVKRVIVSAPSPDPDITVVYGINHKDINDSHSIISNGSCTTNCITPIVYLLDKHFKIKCGYMTTIHSYTGDQHLLDTFHKDPRRARAACLSMIPSSTGAARSVGLIIPHLKGKIDGTAVRVPTSNVSLIDFKCVLDKKTSKQEIDDIMKDASRNNFNRIIGFCEEPLVSCDFNHSKESSIFDASGTTIICDNFCRVMSWYDNEFGFSNRMLDLVSYISEKV